MSFTTVTLGTVTVNGLTENQAGYHGTFVKNGSTYSVWFWPDNDHLAISISAEGATWKVTPVGSNG